MLLLQLEFGAISLNFSEVELRQMLADYQEEDLVSDPIDEVVAMMRPWYDNSCFAQECIGITMYNSDMMLYYFGVITFDRIQRGNVMMKISNLAVRGQIYNYLTEKCVNRRTRLFLLNTLGAIYRGAVALKEFSYYYKGNSAYKRKRIVLNINKWSETSACETETNA